MISRWNAKADTVSTSVLWLGSVIAAIVCVAWLARNLEPDHVSLQHIDNELTEMQKEMNKACRMQYWRNYFPRVNGGNLIINDMQICIDSSQCNSVYFKGRADEHLGYDLILNNVSRCDSITECTPYYYSGDIPPIITNDSIILINATKCENEKTPIVRCRLLTCYLNTTIYVSLEELLYINISREKNGSLSLETH